MEEAVVREAEAEVENQWEVEVEVGMGMETQMAEAEAVAVDQALVERARLTKMRKTDQHRDPLQLRALLA